MLMSSVNRGSDRSAGASTFSGRSEEGGKDGEVVKAALAHVQREQGQWQCRLQHLFGSIRRGGKDGEEVKGALAYVRREQG